MNGGEVVNLGANGREVRFTPMPPYHQWRKKWGYRYSLWLGGVGGARSVLYAANENYPCFCRESNHVLSAHSPFITFRKVLFRHLLVMCQRYIIDRMINLTTRRPIGEWSTAVRILNLSAIWVSVRLVATAVSRLPDEETNASNPLDQTLTVWGWRAFLCRNGASYSTSL
jgi:hypothetical protein